MLLLALTAGAANKAIDLRKAGVTVELIGAGRHGGPQSRFDLSTTQGRHAFIESLDARSEAKKLSAEQKASLEAILENGSDTTLQDPEFVKAGAWRYKAAVSILDVSKIAELIESWVRAEFDEEIPGRFILAGHGAGGSVYRGEAGSGKEKHVQAVVVSDILRALPAAKAQLDDFYIAACYSGVTPADVDRWREQFPNSVTVVAYDDKSPKSETDVGEDHLLRWELKTRGDKKDISPRDFADLPAGDAIVTWTEKGGYQSNELDETPAQIKLRVARFEPTWKKYFEGKKEIGNGDALRPHYQALLKLEPRDVPPGAPMSEERKAIERTFLLLKYNSVREVFQKRYGREISAAYEQLDLNSPDFSKLSRKEALEDIEDFEDNVIKHPNNAAIASAWKKLKGLRDLNDFELVPRGSL